MLEAYIQYLFELLQGLVGLPKSILAQTLDALHPQPVYAVNQAAGGCRRVMKVVVHWVVSFPCRLCG